MTPHVRARHHAGAVCPANRGKVPLTRSLARSHHSSTDKLVSWFLQLSLLAVWKSLTTLSAPVARVLAVYVWAGKSVLKICSWATRLVLKLTGWLGSPAFPHSKWVRQWSKHMPWPLDVRKWHVVVGTRGTVQGWWGYVSRGWCERPSQHCAMCHIHSPVFSDLISAAWGGLASIKAVAWLCMVICATTTTAAAAAAAGTSVYLHHSCCSHLAPCTLSLRMLLPQPCS